MIHCSTRNDHRSFLCGSHRKEVQVVVGVGCDPAAPGRQDAAEAEEEHNQYDAGAAQDGALDQRPAAIARREGALALN